MFLLKQYENDVITPITTSRNTPEWVFCRQFSFTSYPTDHVANTSMCVSKDATEMLGIEEDDIATFKNI